MRKLFDASARYVRESDMFLLATCLVCSIFGAVLISSAARVYNGSHLAVQVLAIVLGIVIYILTSLVDIDLIADKYKLLFVIGALFLLTLIWGVEGDSGNRAWHRFAGIGIQPAEVVKILFIIILAQMISEKRDRRALNAPASILSLFGVFAAYFVIIVVVSRDLGSALVYLFIMLAMLFIGGVSMRWFALGLGAVAASAPLLWRFFLTDRQKLRVQVLFDASLAATEGLDTLWQTNQSKLAISAGEFLGQGLFNGRMTKTDIIPQQHTDFIFSAAGEELGFVGCIFIMLLLSALIVRCFYVGVKANNTLGRLVCTGVAATLIFQTLENIGMCLGLTPVIGLTLPFFSYGGTSIVTSFAMMGLVSGVKMRPRPASYRNM